MTNFQVGSTVLLQTTESSEHRTKESLLGSHPKVSAQAEELGQGGELRSFTALAFPPICIHLSWNQFQLESNSVDLCERAACHPQQIPGDASLADPDLSFGLRLQEAPRKH